MVWQFLEKYPKIVLITWKAAFEWPEVSIHNTKSYRRNSELTEKAVENKRSKLKLKCKWTCPQYRADHNSKSMGCKQTCVSAISSQNAIDRWVKAKVRFWSSNFCHARSSITETGKNIDRKKWWYWFKNLGGRDSNGQKIQVNTKRESINRWWRKECGGVYVPKKSRPMISADTAR